MAKRRGRANPNPEARLRMVISYGAKGCTEGYGGT
jgi:hypothetical protein